MSDATVRFFIIPFMIWLLMSVHDGWSDTPTDNHFFVTGIGVFSINSRDGYVDFGNNRLEHTQQKILPAFGLALGKNFRLPLNLRVGVPLLFEYGKIDEGTVEGVLLNDNVEHILQMKTVMYHVGCQPNIQIPFRVAPQTWFYGSIGGGIEYVALFEEERIADDTKTRVIDPYLKDSKKISFSSGVGAGMEITLAPQVSLFVQYVFRLWKPVKVSRYSDLFPLYDKPYYEKFFSHTVWWGILFSRQ